MASKPLVELPAVSIHIYLLILLALLTLLIFYDHLQKRNLPPGPLSLPLLGNYLSLPASHAWLPFTALSKIHGGIYTFYTGLSPRIIISDPQIAFDLLTGRSSKYSSRPRMIAFECYARGASIISQPYGNAWSMRRKVFHQFLNPSAIQIYKERQEAEASRLIHLISEGGNWKEAIMRFGSSTIFTLAYGRRIDSSDSWVLKYKFEHLRYAGSLLVPGNYLVESLPFLNWFPSWIARWKIPIAKRAKQIDVFDDSLVNLVRDDLMKDRGKGKGSLTENMIRAAEGGDRDLRTLRMRANHFSGIPSSLFGAGSVTTISTLRATIFAMITHPNVFKAAQKEIDEIVGMSRSPAFADREKLPYIDAIIKEALRWRPVVPLGLDHATSEDDVYEGYNIPKGTIISYNTWGMHHDPTYFPLADEFAPERHLLETDERYRRELKGEKKFPGKYGHSGFGWGRRICAGADLVGNNMFISLAKLIWAFELMPLEDVDYEAVKFNGEFLYNVEDFECRWRIRGEEYRKVMETEFKAAELVMDNFPPFE